MIDEILRTNWVQPHASPIALTSTLMSYTKARMTSGAHSQPPTAAGADGMATSYVSATHCETARQGRAARSTARSGRPRRMGRQLDGLLDDAANQQVTFRVVDFEASATLAYVFHQFEFGEKSEDAIAAFDAVTGMTFKKSLKEVREVRDFIESLRAIALTPEDSLELIEKIRKEISHDN
ncbi:Scr1 family TA system antitoxin-like transcriptional regulator [Streptomyces sp. NPDC056144]|uniref:Scr1 family TA system antitoxin-like transcriptional regulator n=1 Tax=unclassified Streptomyces TaxID=2593676 RepID=UPI0035DB050F